MTEVDDVDDEVATVGAAEDDDNDVAADEAVLAFEDGVDNDDEEEEEEEKEASIDVDGSANGRYEKQMLFYLSLPLFCGNLTGMAARTLETKRGGRRGRACQIPSSHRVTLSVYRKVGQF